VDVVPVSDVKRMYMLPVVLVTAAGMLVPVNEPSRVPLELVPA
jgi:hypothetical protein